MTRHILGMALSLCLFQAFPTAADAAETVLMTAGEEGSPGVSFGFDPQAAPPVITVRTVLAGVAGSKLSIFIDNSKTAAFDHIFGADECSFVEGARSNCLHMIPKTSPSYETIVSLFKLGKQARITVEDAGVMKMDHRVSLIGFTKAFDK